MASIITIIAGWIFLLRGCMIAVGTAPELVTVTAARLAEVRSRDVILQNIEGLGMITIIPTLIVLSST